MSGGDILTLLTVFVLAAFVGFEVISKVPSILHTPLMSGTNAIHGVVLVGSMAVLGTAHGAIEITLGFLAVVLSTVNVVGGFVVTDRMLEMFKGRQPLRRAADEPGPGPGSAGSPFSITASTDELDEPDEDEVYEDKGDGEAPGPDLPAPAGDITGASSLENPPSPSEQATDATVVIEPLDDATVVIERTEPTAEIERPGEP
ncbi:MAG: NAD(P) transhydrogenase subunit alpha part 2 [Acidimicrobiales bacterium]